MHAYCSSTKVLSTYSNHGIVARSVRVRSVVQNATENANTRRRHTAIVTRWNDWYGVLRHQTALREPQGILKSFHKISSILKFSKSIIIINSTSIYYETNAHNLQLTI